MSHLSYALGSLLHLFYPHQCSGCGTDLLPDDSPLCLKCFSSLPQTDFVSLAGNPVEKCFWGRLAVEAAYSHFYFTPNSIIQHLVHQLKYKNRKDIGVWLGRMMGETMQSSGRFCNIDGIIPLPLFPEKLRKRGYNQAAVIGEGMASTMNVPLITDIVRRTRQTETQTHKNRIDRWQNVEGVFAVGKNDWLFEKQVLLVDDVLTTGATLEACGTVICQEPGVKLYVATLAWTAQY